MAERFDTEDRAWPERPWIMAAIGAVGGLIVHLLTDGYNYSTPMPVWKQAATSFTVIATISSLLTVELRRWTWAIAFAAGWGAVIALVGWFTAQYNQVRDIFEFPFLSGILAVLIAAPLFQTVRDEGAWAFPYARLHRHAWTDAVIGAASLAFTGITFLLAWLIASLFDVIGIEAIKELLKEEWFAWMLAGFAFGGALGVLRERDALVATLQKLVMVVLSVLAPVLAVALAAFLLSLPFTGLKGLWESDIPATPMLLLAGAGAILLVNAVIGDGRDERSPNIWLQRAALVLLLCILPLAILAALSMGERINQYGWTPERIWGVIAVAIAVAYGLAAWRAVYKGRKNFDDPLRPLQTRLAIGLCGLGLLLALPIVDFGAISARSQLARLESGKVKVEEFDWAAMAFDFGPEGRERLQAIERSGPPSQRELAAVALKSQSRHATANAVENRAEAATLDQRLRVIPQGTALSPALLDAIAATEICDDDPCVLVMTGAGSAILAGYHQGGEVPGSLYLTAEQGGRWNHHYDVPKGAGPKERNANAGKNKVDLRTSTVELRPVQRRQLYIDGRPVGYPVE